MDSQSVIAALKAAGWVEVAQKGSHVQLKHPDRPGRVTVPHPRKDLPIGTLRSSEKKPGLKLKCTMGPYIAIIHKEPDSDYGVSFPDLPGCVSAGATLDEARANAAEALALHLAGLAEDGEAAPEPSSLEEIMADPPNRDGVAILVDPPPPGPRAVRINITLPADVLAAVDRYAEAHGLTRSGFLARAARKELESSA